MYIEAVVVCVNYADILKWTLPANFHQFDNMVVVTEESDRDTIALCQFYDVRYIICAGNKGVKINHALGVLSKRDWVVQLDADIYLPPQTMNIIRRQSLAGDTIYGIDRCMCYSYSSFIDFLSGNRRPYDGKYFTIPPFPIGARISQHYEIGYMPIGYFQLWNPCVSGVLVYPEVHETEGLYARTDIQMARSFLNRGLLPSPLCVHLEEGMNKMGANWNGRCSPPFGDVNICKVSNYIN